MEINQVTITDGLDEWAALSRRLMETGTDEEVVQPFASPPNSAYVFKPS
jgi:hypothetical protein